MMSDITIELLVIPSTCLKCCFCFNTPEGSPDLVLDLLILGVFSVGIQYWEDGIAEIC